MVIMMIGEDQEITDFENKRNSRLQNVVILKKVHRVTLTGSTRDEFCPIIISVSSNNVTNGNICRVISIRTYYYYYYYFFFFFLYPRYLESRGLKAYTKNSWND